MAELIKVDNVDPQPAFARCRQIVSRGGVVVYPTDTFYGLGVDPGNAAAVQRLFEIKGRALDQPILILLPDVLEVKRWAEEVSPEAEELMRKFWPGPLTLVFKAKKHVFPLLTAGKGTIGLRVPGNALTRQLLAFLGTGLTGTSANRTGGESARNVREASEALGSLVDLILDGGCAAGGKPSTVADVSGGRTRILREGAIVL
ncbi:MAG: threonylcarbamoyl-AMP synthase [Nitrospirae bacterium GWD2_57_9]|nr:MAG: threonylcarbamoyl-AMP synthase [Nitrospirae bacterium GWD2_57_9]OGW48916.1 MAG: threonylcarbamoyl-AMP synthase [Nitrospirae bacterium GWC2_57_9]